MQKKFSLARPVAAIALVGLLVGFAPAVVRRALADQPVGPVALGHMQSKAADAVLYYSPASNTFSITYALQQGAVNTKYHDGTSATWAITTYLSYSFDGYFNSHQLVGCFNTADGTAASGQGIPGTGTIYLTGCNGQPTSAPLPGSALYWSFSATFLSTTWRNPDPGWVKQPSGKRHADHAVRAPFGLLGCERPPSHQWPGVQRISPARRGRLGPKPQRNGVVPVVS